MRKSKNIQTEHEMELVKLLMAECQTTGDIQEKLKRLFAGTIEQMLEAEMDEHLGYDKNSVLGNNSGNSRNGYNRKTITSDYGSTELSVPRDRNGEFEPQVLEKRQVRTDEIEQKIMAMYSKGMSTRDIEDTIREIYGADVSPALVLKITDKILPEVNEWQNRPLESIYPIVYFDGVVFKSRKDNQIINKCCYSVLGINDGRAKRNIRFLAFRKRRCVFLGWNLLRPEKTRRYRYFRGVSRQSQRVKRGYKCHVPQDEKPVMHRPSNSQFHKICAVQRPQRNLRRPQENLWCCEP